jgi:hypothetical protein
MANRIPLSKRASLPDLQIPEEWVIDRFEIIVMDHLDPQNNKDFKHDLEAAFKYVELISEPESEITVVVSAYGEGPPFSIPYSSLSFPERRVVDNWIRLANKNPQLIEFKQKIEYYGAWTYYVRKASKPVLANKKFAKQHKTKAIDAATGTVLTLPYWLFR